MENPELEIDLSALSASEVHMMSGPVLLTAEGHKRLQQELDHLTTVKRTEIADRLRDSKDHGEFSEDNQELDEAKFEQKLVEDRINELKGNLANAQIIDFEALALDHVGVGSVVSVQDADRGNSFDIRLVSSIEANPDNDLISIESPMGVALMGAEKDQTVEFDAPAGKMKYKIVGISK
jgi:transcription elongation factor GreA